MFYRESLIFASGGRSNYRIPSVIVTNRGTVLAFCNDRKDTLADHADEVSLVLCVKRAEGDWGTVCELAGLEGWSCGIGSAVYDDTVDRAIVFCGRNPVARNEFGKYTPEEIAEMDRRAEEARRRAEAMGIRAGGCMFLSEDDGVSWREEPLVIAPTEQIHYDGTRAQVQGSTHGAAHGIRLRRGAHRGRLLCPSRTAIGEYNDWEGLRKCVYNNAIYSDDHGMTWQASGCVQLGTGEGTLIERADGSILYNSRAYFRDQKRYLATSTDGGATWGDFRTDDFLIEEQRIGCNASFLRVPREELRDPSLLPPGADGVTVFCNPRAETRRNMTACVSFDGGGTWSHTKTFWEGPAAYSSLDYDHVTGHFHLLYEKGKGGEDRSPYSAGICAAEFDLAWLLDIDGGGI